MEQVTLNMKEISENARKGVEDLIKQLATSGPGVYTSIIYDAEAKDDLHSHVLILASSPAYPLFLALAAGFEAVNIEIGRMQQHVTKQMVSQV